MNLLGMSMEFNLLSVSDKKDFFWPLTQDVRFYIFDYLYAIEYRYV